ncbi:MAG TPA: prolipoprotein diacylglyceryl transferase [Acidimicrobiales bacterium]|nr:prolipoprotein diacylglyceryl transferase [Acidimicrobiales bacterium]
MIATFVASIPSPSSNKLEIGPLDLTFYGMLIALGALAAIALAQRRWSERGGDPELVQRIGVWSVAAGVLGARVAYLLPRLERFEGRWIEMLYIWEGGLAIFGGLIAGTLTGCLMARRANVDLLDLLDAVAPAIPLAQAIGRWGNYFNQELFGRPTGVPWGLEIAPENRPPAFADAELFHPTFLYESLWNLAIVALLVYLDRRRVLARGNLFVAYLGLYGIGRFWIELLRVDTTFRFLGLSRNALFALAVAVTAAVVLVLRRRRRDPEDQQPSDLTAPGKGEEHG